MLAHENEKEIFGDAPDRCADLITEGFTLAAQSLKMILNELGIPWR